MDGARLSDLPVSVVIPALSEGQNLVDTVAGVRANSGDLDPEVIVVDDGSSDGAPQRVAARFARDPHVRVIHGPQEGIARARNAGADAARGRVIVFLDGHCHVPQGWLAPLVEALDDPAVGLVGPAFSSIREPRIKACGITWSGPDMANVWLPATHDGAVPFHIGACQAVRAGTFHDIGGFDAGMTRWGSEDIEICLRMWVLGHEVRAVPQSLVYHLFRDKHPYAVQHEKILYNHLRMALLHFDEPRLARMLDHFQRNPGSPAALAHAYANGVVAERERLFAERVRDVDWLFDKFGIGF
ncbi:glycosyltransferase [Thalassococcus sp. BH17M4-6]|uniref:glycosyltransferase n=1 Tax=Thalassococcus sp. BH17M4-6 TaxID=3413148 RepID=UPI003BEE8483